MLFKAQQAAPSHRILVFGVARSGTTWLAAALAEQSGAALVKEPDNQYMHPYALRAKSRLATRGFFPRLAADEDREDADDYARLWTAALGMARPNPAVASADELRRLAARALQKAGSIATIRRVLTGRERPNTWIGVINALAAPTRPPPGARTVIAKSVYGLLAAGWIATKCRARVCVVLRDPRSVIASWKRLGWLGRPGFDALDNVDEQVRAEFSRRSGIPQPRRDASPLERAAWMWGFLNRELLEEASDRPDWKVLRLEALAADPAEGFRGLSRDLGLPLVERARIERISRGYRIADPASPSDQGLTADEVEAIARTIEHFDLARFAPAVDAAGV